MTLPALQAVPVARLDAPPLVPIDLGHYRGQWPPYLARPGDREIVAAVLAATAWRRRTWPTNERARRWCEFEEPELLAYLNDIAGRDAWHDLHEVRRQSGGLVAAGSLPFPQDRRHGAEKIASYAAAVPRMRAIGAFLADAAAASLSPDHDHDATADATGGDEGSGGGRKAKPPKPKADEEDDPDALFLRAEEIEALNLLPKPPGR